LQPQQQQTCHSCTTWYVRCYYRIWLMSWCCHFWNSIQQTVLLMPRSDEWWISWSHHCRPTIFISHERRGKMWQLADKDVTYLF